MRKYTHKILLATALGLAALVAGCVSPNTPPSDDPASPTGNLTQDMLLQLAVKAGTSEILGGDKQDAERVVRLTDTGIRTIDSGQITVPEAFDGWLITQIMDQDFEPSTKQALIVFKDGLAEQLTRRIDAGQLDPGTTAPVKTVLTWVKEAAEDTITYGTQQDYGIPPVADSDTDAPYGDYWNPHHEDYEPPQYAETWETPLWAKWKYGSHWSDTIVGFVLGPFGVEDYAGLRGWHSYGLDSEEKAEFAEWKADRERVRRNFKWMMDNPRPLPPEL